MSARVGRALAEYLRRHLAKGERNFVLVEGVPLSVAEGMSASWDTELPQLAVVSPAPARFGSHAMRDVSGTQLRNRSAGGVVLVLCDGEQVPDRQSLNLFESISPSVLLETAEGIAILAQQPPALNLDGVTRAVREAINRAPVSSRPSAGAVATYLDIVATGADPLEALPTLGAFTDRVPPGARVDSERIGDNLSLAARRTGDDLLKPTAFADLRKRTEAVLSRRPDVGMAGAAVAADLVMTQLQTGSDDLLSTLRFDEALEIFEQRPRALADVVLQEMVLFRSRLDSGSQAAGLPWHTYELRAEELRRTSSQRSAAQDLCDLDDAQQKEVFTRPTRRKLERLLRDRAVNGSNPSCPEAAMVRATQQLGGPIQRVQVLGPQRPINPDAAHNRTGAGRIITLACARLRLGALLRGWEASGCDVDGLLLRAADDGDLGDILATFAAAGIVSGAQLPALQLRLHAGDGSTVQVDWKPDLDDVATLRAAVAFAEAPVLSLTLPTEPSLHAFCGPMNTGTVQEVPADLMPVARALQQIARGSLDRGLEPSALRSWVDTWRAVCAEREAARDSSSAEALALAGAVCGNRAVALTAFAPMKAEWLAQYLDALWSLATPSKGRETTSNSSDNVATSEGIARATATHHPAYLRLSTQDRVLLPTSEGRIWSLYGGRTARDESGYSGEALSSVVVQLLRLQPEAAGHLRCLAWGAGAADLLVAEAVKLINRRVGLAQIRRIEIFCIGTRAEDRPRPETLANADDQLRNERDVLELRYLDDLSRARELLRPTHDSPAVHLALVTGLTDGPNALQIETREVAPPDDHPEVLFAPRVWQRPRQDRRILLMPPTASAAGQAWLRVQNAVYDGWPDEGDPLQVPEVRTGALDIASKLREVHDLSLWVATLDRYATRDSLEHALGVDNVAILHQERRLGGDSPLSLVLSQKSGGPADRAIGRSLRAAGIIREPDVALSIGTQLRRVASQGYGILALQAATSGAGINELVGHVVAFSLLATTTTPWPLPPGCRVLLVSLDEYRHWFPKKRADLLAIALDTRDRGVHIATIEVKARRSDEHDAAASALDQLNQSLAATKWAAYPEAGSVHSRLWLNRIAEAAYAVARESRFRLDRAELDALEAFRRGTGTLEWAGVGLVFGPRVERFHRTYRTDVANDIVPVVLHSIPLTEELLQTATATSLTELRTVETARPPLQSTRTRRRPEGSGNGNGNGRRQPDLGEGPTYDGLGNNVAQVTGPPPAAPEDPGPERPTETQVAQSSDNSSGADHCLTSDTPSSEAVPSRQFVAPLIGWDAVTGDEIRWHAAGTGQTALQNGHTEIWGSSGMGKTQFAMSLLGQLAKFSGSRFGIADFKNDYSDDTGFPAFADARFIDLWNEGAPFNPLALDDDGERSIQSAIIELRDTVDEALRSVNARLGVRQRAKLEKALKDAYSVRSTERRWPTLRTLDDQLDADLAGVIGDLTKHDLFKSGEPLGNVIDSNMVFGLSRIPGNGQTTVLAAGFILSSLLLRIQNLPPVPNSIRYVMVVDEAHRVAPFRAIQTMIREGRSKGLAVILATQGPLDLPEVVAANAQTKICFGLPDATVATMAARKLQPDNPRLAEQIRTLGTGEAFVSFAGEAPRLVRVTQAYRDHTVLQLPELRPLSGEQ
ncbi:ATP-binding protein [Actinotalea caeni]|uniref:ATP-binding protein n=1 Tax=Actinotalea caeni TaxID=1348467 RepID=UPI001478135C|nr:helicase HerA-like domain-containing protein [Actinotalea caeni]